MTRRPQSSYRTASLYPYTTLSRSARTSAHRVRNVVLLVIIEPAHADLRGDAAEFLSRKILAFEQRQQAPPLHPRRNLGAHRLADRRHHVRHRDEGRLADLGPRLDAGAVPRSEEHTSELQSLMRISYAVFCLKKKKDNNI